MTDTLTPKDSHAEEALELERRLLSALGRREEELERLEAEIEAYRRSARALHGDAPSDRHPLEGELRLELLRRIEGMERRLEHLRVGHENLDRKVEALGEHVVSRLADFPRARTGWLGQSAGEWWRLLIALGFGALVVLTLHAFR